MNKREPLKAGDRVRVYGYCRHNGEDPGVIGTVTNIGSPTRIVVTFADSRAAIFSPKQLRRLKPKREPRRVWLSHELLAMVDGRPEELVIQSVGDKPILTLRTLSANLPPGYAPFLEVRRKEPRA